MHGTIIFESWADLAEFLKEFYATTALFEVRKENERRIVLQFTGGY